MDLRPKDIIRTKLTQPPQHELKVELVQKELVVKYAVKTWRALYDISDINGRVLMQGEIGNEEIKINLNHLKTGNYILWIVDGADLIKYNFNIK